MIHLEKSAYIAGIGHFFDARVLGFMEREKGRPASVVSAMSNESRHTSIDGDPFASPPIFAEQKKPLMNAKGSVTHVFTECCRNSIIRRNLT